MLIYVHGWTVGSTSDSFKESFDWRCAGWPDIDVITHWRAMGWNVGLFHWNQFADKLIVTDAEAKIWTANGSKSMRLTQATPMNFVLSVIHWALKWQRVQAIVY